MSIFGFICVNLHIDTYTLIRLILHETHHSSQYLYGGSMLAVAEAPLWMRDARISPDGKTIAFTYKGDIFTVPAAGGEATRLTSDRATSSCPYGVPTARR